MPLAKCARCKKMFNKEDSPICRHCIPAEEADYDKVRAALEKEPRLNAEEVAAKAEVDVECVKRMLEAGVIEAVTGEGVRCGMCGAPAISASKRLCQACLDKLNMDMAKAQSKIRLGMKKPPEIGGKADVHQAFDAKRRVPGDR